MISIGCVSFPIPFVLLEMVIVCTRIISTPSLVTPSIFGPLSVKDSLHSPYTLHSLHFLFIGLLKSLIIPPPCFLLKSWTECFSSWCLGLGYLSHCKLQDHIQLQRKTLQRTERRTSYQSFKSFRIHEAHLKKLHTTLNWFSQSVVTGSLTIQSSG